MNNQLRSTEGNFLFNLDILINAKTNPLALQYLLELLNGSEHVTDFKINSSLQLGKTIDELLRNAKRNLSESKARTAGVAPTESAKPAAKPDGARAAGEARKAQTTETVVTAASAAGAPTPAISPAAPVAETAGGDSPFGIIYSQIREFIRNNQLIRIRANRYGKQISIPCRILNFDESMNTLNVYHVDEKQVYTFKLNEIDELTN